MNLPNEDEKSKTPEFRDERWTTIEIVDVDPQSLWLVVRMANTEGTSSPVFRLPTEDDKRPENWWIVYALTGLEGVHKSNSKEQPPFSVRAREELAKALRGVHVPYRPVDGTVDYDELLRRGVVANLYRDRTNLPHLLQIEPAIDLVHARQLMRAVLGAGLYRHAVDDAQLGRLALVIDHDGRKMLLPVQTKPQMRGILLRSVRLGKGGSDYIVEDLAAYPDRALPVLAGIARVPVLRTSGSVLETPGYDPETGLYFAPDVTLEPVPTSPTVTEVALARELLLEPLAEFPFVSEHARSGVIAAMLEQVVLPLIHGPRPLYCLDARAPGTGKTLLASMVHAVVEGRDAPVITSLGRREEEVEKRITSLLLTDARVVIIDNLTELVDSPSLMQLGTARSWQARILGGSTSPVIPQRTTWLLTMNDARLARDIARRVLLIELDAGVQAAWTRSGFRIGDLIRWVLARRSELVRALLVLARAWFAAGRPKDPEIVRGSYESWAHVVGGIIYSAGLASLMPCLNAADSRDVTTHQFKELCVAWSLTKPTELLAAQELADLAINNNLYDYALRGLKPGLAAARKISDLIRPMLGTRASGMTIVEAGVRRGCRVYALAAAPS